MEMKARIKSTGEIVEVEDLYDNGTALVNGGYFKVSELDFFTRVRDKDCVKNRVKRAKIVRFTLC